MKWRKESKRGTCAANFTTSISPFKPLNILTAFIVDSPAQQFSATIGKGKSVKQISTFLVRICPKKLPLESKTRLFIASSVQAQSKIKISPVFQIDRECIRSAGL